MAMTIDEGEGELDNSMGAKTTYGYLATIAGWNLPTLERVTAFAHCLCGFTGTSEWPRSETGHPGPHWPLVRYTKAVLMMSLANYVRGLKLR